MKEESDPGIKGSLRVGLVASGEPIQEPQDIFGWGLNESCYDLDRL
jgi:hypothetical protein